MFNGYAGNINNSQNINQYSYQAFLTFMGMNQYMNSNTQMSLNDFMNLYMLMFPYFFQNNPNTPVNKSNYTPIQSTNKGSVLINNYVNSNGGVLPRPKKVINKHDNQNPFLGYKGPIINITFETGSGIKKNIPTPSDVKIKDLLIEFTKRVGVSKDLIGNKLLFVVNGAAINKINENKTVEQFFTMLTSYLSTQIKITVIDASNLIGA